jgi:aminopeptidase
MDAAALDRYADLIVSFGANFQAGQQAIVGSSVGKEELTRAIVRRLYQQGAVFVHTVYADPYIQRARIEYAVDEALGYEPDWVVQMMREHGEHHGATIGLSGNPAPGLLNGLDPARIGRDLPPGRKQGLENLMRAANNWTAAPCPTEGWARLVHPDLEPEAAVERLWQQVLRMCRMDADDPVAEWAGRHAQLEAVKRALDGLALDAVQLEGPGTDLTVGLLPTSRWMGISLTTSTGIEHRPNLPSEEVFATPDPSRADGVVRATKPRELAGVIVRDLVVRFEGGRVVELDAAEGGEALRATIEGDAGGTRLGELALVDANGRVGPENTVFYDTLLDENAASHLAFGQGFEWAVGEPDRARINHSQVHIDFMIGSDQVSATGITRDGTRVPLLAGGQWQML